MDNKKRKIKYNLRCPFCKKTAVYCFCGSFDDNGELREKVKKAVSDKSNYFKK